jgi:hypothetical protein
MKSKLSMLKSIAVVAALVAGVSGVARADNDMNPFNGESYEYFKNAQAIAGNGPSTFHQSNPNGVSESELQAGSSSGSPVWQPNRFPTTAAAKAPSEWRQSHPHGLSERELQALSSDGSPVWRLPTTSEASSFASTSDPAFTMSAGYGGH